MNHSHPRNSNTASEPAKLHAEAPEFRHEQSVKRACEAPTCPVEGEDLLRAEDGSWYCRPHFPVPPLVIEHRYCDGEIGAADVEGETRPHAEALWREFCLNPAEEAKFIVLRRADDEHDGASVFDLANLLRAFPGLVDGESEVNGGDLVDALSHLVQSQFGRR